MSYETSTQRMLRLERERKARTTYTPPAPDYSAPIYTPAPDYTLPDFSIGESTPAPDFGGGGGFDGGGGGSDF